MCIQIIKILKPTNCEFYFEIESLVMVKEFGAGTMFL